MTVKRLQAETLCPLSSVPCPQLANHTKNQPTHQPQRNHHETEHQLERTRQFFILKALCKNVKLIVP